MKARSLTPMLPSKAKRRRRARESSFLPTAGSRGALAVARWNSASGQARRASLEHRDAGAAAVSSVPTEIAEPSPPSTPTIPVG
jgi:hypothetical protein